jgi:hypothetical protein
VHLLVVNVLPNYITVGKLNLALFYWQKVTQATFLSAYEKVKRITFTKSIVSTGYEPLNQVC